MMIANHWPAEFRKLYGGGWPRDYFVIDVETTGLDLQNDLIVEFGHCLVRNGAVVDRLTTIVDWTKHQADLADAIEGKLQNVSNAMAARGVQCHLDFQRMKREGKPPEEVFTFYAQMINTLLSKGVPVIGHNIYAFDEPMFLNNIQRFKFPKVTFNDNCIIDTNGIEKANGLGPTPVTVPKPTDTLRSYFMRLNALRIKGLKSNLGEHCFVKYGFDQHVNKSQMHNASVDAFCVHILMEKFRQLLVPETETETLVAASPAVIHPESLTRYRGQRNS